MIELKRNSEGACGATKGSVARSDLSVNDVGGFSQNYRQL
jgi:hypothetical protein